MYMLTPEERERLIDALVQDDIDAYANSPGDLEEIFRYGIRGYDNMSGEEIVRRYRNDIDDEYI